jgi:hypothetical protein
VLLHLRVVFNPSSTTTSLPFTVPPDSLLRSGAGS